jgi:hypothetical protein
LLTVLVGLHSASHISVLRYHFTFLFILEDSHHLHSLALHTQLFPSLFSWRVIFRNISPLKPRCTHYPTPISLFTYLSLYSFNTIAPLHHISLYNTPHLSNATLPSHPRSSPRSWTCPSSSRTMHPPRPWTQMRNSPVICGTVRKRRQQRRRILSGNKYLFLDVIPYSVSFFTLLLCFILCILSLTVRK